MLSDEKIDTLKKGLTEEQAATFEGIVKFARQLKDKNEDFLKESKNKQTHITVTGYAGVGKTFLIKKIYDTLKGKAEMRFAAFTGKAAENLIKKAVPCQTLHSLIYSPREEEGRTYYEKKDSLDTDLIIIDESSMLEQEYIDDLKSFNIPIIFFGDTFQLPPISGIRPEALVNHNYEITQIMRNAGIIIENLTRIRNFQPLKIGVQKDDNGSSFSVLFKGNKRVDEKLLEFDRIICGTNAERNRLNTEIRFRKGLKSTLPEIGEEIICLKNTNMEDTGVSLKNGEIVVVKGISKGAYPLDGHETVVISYEKNGKTEVVTASAKMFDDYKTSTTKYTYNYAEFKNLVFFDFAYALTAHKSQGSEYEKVLVLAYDMTWMKTNYVNAVYTAAGRAQKHVIIVIETLSQLERLTKKYT